MTIEKAPGRASGPQRLRHAACAVPSERLAQSPAPQCVVPGNLAGFVFQPQPNPATNRVRKRAPPRLSAKDMSGHRLESSRSFSTCESPLVLLCYVWVQPMKKTKIPFQFHLLVWLGRHGVERIWGTPRAGTEGVGCSRARLGSR